MYELCIGYSSRWNFCQSVDTENVINRMNYTRVLNVVRRIAIILCRNFYQLSLLDNSTRITDSCWAILNYIIANALTEIGSRPCVYSYSMPRPHTSLQDCKSTYKWSRALVQLKCFLNTLLLSYTIFSQFAR